MEFAYPTFLFALFAILIPILIHLFNFRKYKKIYFSNVKFLKEVQQRTKSQSKLKHLLVLLSRILVIIFLVLAFAQPFIPNNQKAKVGTKGISVYLDNSQSMEGENKEGSLLEVAKKYAEEWVENFQPTDRFQLLTNNFDGYQQRLLTKEEFIEAVEQVKISPKTRSIEEVLSRQKDVLNSSEFADKQVAWISDFQKSTANLNQLNIDTSLQYNIIPVKTNEAKNVWIDSAWFDTPVRILNQSERLNVRIRNSGNEDLESMPITLEINGAQIAVGSYAAAANSVVDTVLNFTNKTAGIFNATLSINDYPISFDDDYYLTFEVAAKIPVLELKGQHGNNAFSELLREDEFYQYTQTPSGTIDYAQFATQNVIILNELESFSSGLIAELIEYAENGGSVVVIPSKNANKASFSKLLLSLGAQTVSSVKQEDREVNYINLSHPTYRDVFEKIPRNLDLPKTKNHIVWKSSVRSTEQVLMRLATGDSFLSQFKKKKGKVYVFGSNFSGESTNFTSHALFVTTLLRIAEMAKESGEMAFSLGENTVIEVNSTALNSQDEIYKLSMDNANFDFVPSFQNIGTTTKIFVGDQIEEAGNYNLFLGTQKQTGFGFNFNRKESALDTYNGDELNEAMSQKGFNNFNIIKSTDTTVSAATFAASKDKKYWKICVILALIFLAIETLIFRFWKS